MTKPGSPFEAAERFIQLRRKCAPLSWGDSMIRINEMILTPLICIFFLILGQADLMLIISSCISTFRSWSEWIEYQELRILVQRMYLVCMATGGPFIRTNDNDYLPYVFADAVVRRGMRRQDSETGRPKEEHETHSQ
jgi:hypothetical protein